MKKSKRIFENPVTSIVGGLIILGTIGLVYVGKANIVEASGWVTLGATFLRAKDSLLGVKGLGE